MTDTAELIARVKQAATDLHLAAKLNNKPPLSAAFVLDDVTIVLAAQAQEIERRGERWQEALNDRDAALARAKAAEARIRELEIKLSFTEIPKYFNEN